MRAGGIEANAVGADGQAGAAAIVMGAGRGDDRPEDGRNLFTVQATGTHEGFQQPPFLPAQTGLVVEVLQLAATAAAEDGTGRLDPLGSRVEPPDDAGAGPAGAALCQLHLGLFAGQEAVDKERKPAGRRGGKMRYTLGKTVEIVSPNDQALISRHA